MISMIYLRDNRSKKHCRKLTEKGKYMSLLDGLSAMQRKAVEIIDDDLEIIACAGAGKTGVVTRRIINILQSKPDILPENIVAFTFTRRAAEELKSRIYELAKQELGNTHGFANMYVGTIHGFCIKMLQEYISEFQKFTVLDEIHTKLFVERYYDECGMQDLDLKKYIETGLFINVMNILNENWFEQDKWDDITRIAFGKYKDKLYFEKKFDYSLILQEMINQLENNDEFAQAIRDKVKFLTVDEYQDTNPIQEKLIEILKGVGANICVVGDDDQTIYQFRGSDAQNILTFQDRYQIKHYIVLDENYRSTEGIVDVAGKVIANNNNRLSKIMKSSCKTLYDLGDIVYEEWEDTEQEYKFIANQMEKLHDIGVPYSEMAVLLRKKKISAQIADKLKEYGIPYVVEGMNELFDTKECQAAKGIYDYLNGDLSATELYEKWLQVDYPFDKKELADSLQVLAVVDVKEMKLYSDLNLQQIYHDFFGKLSIVEDGRIETEIILYNLGKFSQVIADYEVINYTVRPKSKLMNFCSFLKYTATEYYPEGHLSNSYTKPEAVSIMTIHQAKGLEYAAVFIPQLNKNFFPAQRIGGKGIWHVLDRSWIADANRFDGDMEEERKLFYVAVTRAKKYLNLSRSKNTRDKHGSEFLLEAKDSSYLVKYDASIGYNASHLPAIRKESMPLTLNFSLLEDYFECPYRFKLSMVYGFVQPIMPALGYGNVMHEVVKNIHKKAMEGTEITQDLIDQVIDSCFYLPYATPKLEERMYGSVKRSIRKYVENCKGDFEKIRMAEAEIEIDMGDGVRVNGRIDMIKHYNEDGEERTAIVDFKTANKRVLEQINTQQLKIYALGYKALTGQTADCMEIYHLDSQNSARKSITETVIREIAQEMKAVAENIRSNNLPRQCNPQRCSECHSNYLCLSKKEQQQYIV